MKVTTKYLHTDYIRDLKTIKDSTKKEIESYEKSKKYILEKLKIYKHYIENFTNIIYREIENLERIIPEKSLVYLVNIAGIDVHILRRNINIVVEINKSLNKLEKRLQEVNENIVGYQVYKEIIYKFNGKLSEQIISKGYRFELGYSLGYITIKKVNCMYNKNGSLRTKKRVDWGESNKLKKRIIEDGNLPYKVLNRDENGKIVEDNGGLKYILYHEKEWDYLWHWYKADCKVLNSPYFRFRPTIYDNTTRDGKTGNVNKLKQLVMTNSPLLTNFS